MPDSSAIKPSTYRIREPAIGDEGSLLLHTHHFAHVLKAGVIGYQVIEWRLVVFNDPCGQSTTSNKMFVIYKVNQLGRKRSILPPTYTMLYKSPPKKHTHFSSLNPFHPLDFRINCAQVRSHPLGKVKSKVSFCLYPLDFWLMELTP